MRLSTHKCLAMTPWELVRALVKAGVIEDDTCNTDVQVVSRTEINEGRTVLVSWSNRETDLSPNKD